MRQAYDGHMNLILSDVEETIMLVDTSEVAPPAGRINASLYRFTKSPLLTVYPFNHFEPDIRLSVTSDLLPNRSPNGRWKCSSCAETASSWCVFLITVLLNLLSPSFLVYFIFFELCKRQGFCWDARMHCTAMHILYTYPSQSSAN